MDRLRTCLVLGAMIAVNGCGGGGGSAGTPPFGSPAGAPTPTPSPSPTPTPPPAPAPATAEGLWIGTTSLGFNFTLLTLETGDSWAVYGGSNAIAGVVHAQLSTDGTNATGSGFDYSIANRAQLPASLAGTYTPKGTHNGVLTSGGVDSNYSTNYSAQYEQGASLANLSGTWSVTAASLSTTATSVLQIATDGSFTGSYTVCSMTGTLAPRASGKNVFNLSAAFTGAACPFDAQSLSGVATLVTEGGQRRLTAMALTADSSDGFFATGTR